MELLAPAGNLEKLRYAYLYGADAAYIGLSGFSLRAKADNMDPGEYERAKALKGARRLYGAVNIVFHNRDLYALESTLDAIDDGLFDAFIISDIGVLPALRRRFPRIQLHLSTQANCSNAEAARIYRDMGFKRIIPGRETSLEDIRTIKAQVPDLEIEVFVHGAMCLAYSGRCFLSSYMADRSGNRGECSHPCRWNYRLLEEAERPGEYFPVLEGDGFTTILSSRDLCMIDHLSELKEAGVDALKIEGRMKSIYYTAVVTRAYRKGIDMLSSGNTEAFTACREELFKVSHREFTTGFYFSREEADKTTALDYSRSHIFLGTLEEETAPGRYRLSVKNQIRMSEPVEFLGPEVLSLSDGNFRLFDEEGNPAEQADHGKYYEIVPGVPVQPGYILRKKIDVRGE